MKFSYFKYCLVLFLLWSSISGNAQNLFTKAYITLSNKDTLKGYLLERGKYDLAKTIIFKSDITSAEVTYSIGDINSFYLYDYDEMYLSRQVDIDKKPIETRELEMGLAKKIQNDRILLRFLVRGELDLLQHIDENRKQHYFFKKGEEVKELGYVRYMAKSGLMTSLPEYKNQLRTLFSDCAKLAKADPSYTENSLAKVFREYNSCNQSLTYTKKKEKTKIKVALFAGEVFNQFTYSGVDNFNYEAGGVTYKTPSTQVAGLSFDFLSKKKSGKTNWTADLFWRESGNCTASNNVTDYFTTRKDYYVQYGFLELNGGFKYFLLKKPTFSYYFKLGGGYRYLLNSKTGVVTTLFNVSRPHTPLVDLSKSGIGFTASVGASIKRFQVEVGYDYTRFTVSATKTTLSLSSPMVTLGYRLNK
jgi:hypothetical protein